METPRNKKQRITMDINLQACVHHDQNDAGSRIPQLQNDAGLRIPEPQNYAGFRIPEQQNHAGFRIPERRNHAGFRIPEQRNYAGFHIPEQRNYARFHIPERRNYAGFHIPERRNYAGFHIPERRNYAIPEQNNDILESRLLLTEKNTNLQAFAHHDQNGIGSRILERQPTEKNTKENNLQATVHHDQNDVGFRILERLLTEKNTNNLVFSPLSIYMMLTLLAAAASKDGPILHDLLSFLNFKSIDELNSFLSKLFPAVFGDTSAGEGPCVVTANGIWLADDLPVKPSFRTLLQSFYKGELKQVDFINKSSEIVREANAWVEKETRGLISQIFNNGKVNQFTKVILANTVYFKAKWKSQFNKSATRNQHFHRLNGSPVDVPFMSSHKDQLISVFDSFKVASLPYNPGFDFTDLRPDPRRFSMLIFLPNDRHGLPSLIQRACSEPGFLDRHRPSKSVPVEEFKIPKFKFEFEFDTKSILEGLGLESLFSVREGFMKETVGFTEMVDDPAGRELFVSGMFHKAVVSVNEEETEAAAITATMMCGSCWMKPIPVIKIKFVADHPFLFVITEDVSNCVVFMGQVLHP